MAAVASSSGAQAWRDEHRNGKGATPELICVAPWRRAVSSLER